jgi:hypothetical protein
MASASTDKYTNHTAVAGVKLVLAVRGPIVLTVGAVPPRDRH